MREKQARKEAAAIAKKDGIRMAVTFNPYHEEEDRDGGYGYVPREAFHIFEAHEVLLDVIEAG